MNDGRALVFVIAGALACAAPRKSPDATRSLPPTADEDGDRIANATDNCPMVAEDVDGFEDTDGCPDVDNDRDRIADTDDRCPNEGEIYNGTDDTDGCPDRGCVLLREYPLCIDERVYFSKGTSTPDAATFGDVLDRMAKTMDVARADIELVTITGYRSGDEPAALATQRAAAIRDQLVTRGADPARFVLVDGGVGAPSAAPNGQRRVAVDITKQRVAYEELDEIVCTPMGRWFVQLTPAEKQARCAHRSAP